MIEGFARHAVPVAPGVTLSAWVGGAGPALVLLHGYPQNHHCWAAVAPALAARHRVLVPDLRGYGDSDAPPDDVAHAAYSKRRMAADIAALLDHFGHAEAALLGHDRGARVAYRMALDAPERVTRLGILEIVPTADFWRAFTAETALKAYHWSFLAQPAPLPERLIAADPGWYVDRTLAAWSGTGSLVPFAPGALASYRAQMAEPARAAAMCADYRAGATTDRRHDEEDRARGRTIACPVRVLIGTHGFPARAGDAAATWRRWAPASELETCDSGHFLPEEAPGAVLDTFAPFLAGA